MNRKNHNAKRNQERKLNKMIRQLCCWNCFQTGHNRFQCPFPKTPSCSYCRKPSVLSINCGCDLSRADLPLQENNEQVVENMPEYDANVLVPVNDENGFIGYQENQNIILVVENHPDESNEEENNYEEETDETDDILEINASETESLSEI